MLKNKNSRPRRTRKRDKIKLIFVEVLIVTAAWKAKGGVAHATTQRNAQQIERLNNRTNIKTQEAFINKLLLNPETEVTKVVDKQGKLIKEFRTQSNRFSRAINSIEQSRQKLIENIDASIQKKLELVTDRLTIKKPKTYRQKIKHSWIKYTTKIKNLFETYNTSFKQGFLDIKNWFLNSFFYFKKSLVKETNLLLNNTGQGIKLIALGIWKTGYFLFKFFKVSGRSIKTLISGGYIVIKLGLKTTVVPVVFTWDTCGLLVETFSITISELFK